ncbi:glycosyltransferase [Thermoanaerobacterium saccharolyticum]|uniref:glycosyltransferase n=1 Tax=Thermoanaerobacterium saccharolyticum TaxID=28896 RepID=UPI002FDA8D33
MTIWKVIGWYVFAYPLAMSIIWISAGIYFGLRREKKHSEKDFQLLAEDWPSVTILVPCHNEEVNIAATSMALQFLDYPDYRVIFIDDASTDSTANVIRRFVKQNSNFHLLKLFKNQGKANALNIAVSIAVTTSITVVIDADTILLPDALKYLVYPYLKQPRLGAVTGNPISINRKNIIEKLQAAEFSSIIGLIKRSQRVLGRVLTVTGAITAYRTEILKEIGGFSPYTATEDIDITWRIQKNFYEVWFVPQAVGLIQSPATLKEYWKQRKRWALGGWHLLRTHKNIFKSWQWRYLYPIYIDFVLGYMWAFCFVFSTFLWIASYLFFPYSFGLSPIPAWYGAILSFVGVIQMTVAVFLNYSYDRNLWKELFWVPWYFIFFFAFGSLTVVWTAPKGLFGSLVGTGKWRSPKRFKT